MMVCQIGAAVIAVLAVIVIVKNYESPEGCGFHNLVGALLGAGGSTGPVF